MAEQSTTEFSVTEAAFAGFRLAGRKPMVVVTWGAFYFVMSVVVGGLMVNLAGPALMQLQGMQTELPIDPSAANAEAVMSLFAQVAPFYMMMIPVSLVFGAIATGAGTRAILRPYEENFSYLRLGVDELRLVVVILAIGLIMAVIYSAGAIVIGVALGALAAAGGSGGPVLPVMVGLICLLLTAMFYLASKFSMAPSLTIDRKAIDIFGSLALTKRDGAKIFLTFVLAVLLNLLLVCAGLAVVAAGAMAMGGGSAASVKAFEPDMRSLTAYFTPLVIIRYAVMSIAGGLGMATMLAAPATIYQALMRDGARKVF